jgi:hypothetical protein
MVNNQAGMAALHTYLTTPGSQNAAAMAALQSNLGVPITYGGLGHHGGGHRASPAPLSGESYARLIAQQIERGELSYERLSPEARANVEKYYPSLSRSQQRAYTRSKLWYSPKERITGGVKSTATAIKTGIGQYKDIIPQRAAGVADWLTPSAELTGRGASAALDISVGAVDAALMKGAEILGTAKTELITRGGVVVEGIRGRGVKADVTASLNRGQAIINAISGAGEYVGMRGKFFATGGIAAGEAAARIEKTGFKGGTYGQETARIEEGLGIKGEPLSNYLGRLDLAYQRAAATGYYEKGAKAEEIVAEAEREGWLKFKWDWTGKTPGKDQPTPSYFIEYPDTAKGREWSSRYEAVLSGLESKPPEVTTYESLRGPIARYEQRYGTGSFDRDLQEMNRNVEAISQLQAQASRGFEVPESSKAWSEGHYITKPVIEGYQRGVESYQKILHERLGWDTQLPKGAFGEFVHVGRYVAEKTPEYLAFVPMAIGSVEAVIREPSLMIASLAPGGLLMARGMAHEAYKEPLGFAATMLATGEIMKGAGKLSPVKYTGRMEFPTGMGEIKSRYQWGAGVPREVLEWQRRGTWGTELVSVGETRMPGLYKATYMVPETVVHRGIYFKTYSPELPYKSIHPLVGETWGPKGTIRGLTIGEKTLAFRSPIESYTPKTTGFAIRELTPGQYVSYLVKAGELQFKYADLPIYETPEGGIFGTSGQIIRQSSPPIIELGSQYKGIGELTQASLAKMVEYKARWVFRNTPREALETYLARQYHEAYGVRPEIPPEVPISKIYQTFTTPTKGQVLFHELTHYDFPLATEPQVRMAEILYGTGKLGERPFTVRVPETSFSLKGVEWQAPIIAGEPLFELPERFRVFTGQEGAYAIKSMRSKLTTPYQQELFDAAFYVMEKLGRQKALVKEPIRLAEVEYIPKEAIPEITNIMRRYRDYTKIYGSEAKAISMARRPGEVGAITPHDIDVEIISLASRMREGLVIPKRYQPIQELSKLGEPTVTHRIVQRLGERMPGPTPESYAREVEAVLAKHLGPERVEVVFNPQWEMWSVRALPEGVKAGVRPPGVLETPGFETVFDIHPESAQFEFGLKPQKPVRTRLEPGFKEPFWRRWQKFDVTPLGEEFERSFGSLIQVVRKGQEEVLMPKTQRIKDIGRFVQTGKTLTKYLQVERKAKGSIFGHGEKEIARLNEAIGKWGEYSTHFPELAEMQEHIAATPMSAGMEKALISKVQRQSFRGMLMSEEAAAPRAGYEELPFGRGSAEAFIDEYNYRVNRYTTGLSKSDYYPTGIKLYSASYQHPFVTGIRTTPRTSAYGYFPKAVPVAIHSFPVVFPRMPSTAPPSRVRGGAAPRSPPSLESPPSFGITPVIPELIVPSLPVITPQLPVTPPPETPPFSPPPTIPPINIPPTYPPIVPIVLPPTVPILGAFPWLEEKPKRRKKVRKRDIYAWKEKHYIASLEELMGWGTQPKRLSNAVKKTKHKGGSIDNLPIYEANAPKIF